MASLVDLIREEEQKTEAKYRPFAQTPRQQLADLRPAGDPQRRAAQALPFV